MCNNQSTCMYTFLFKVPIMSLFFLFCHLILYITQSTSSEKKNSIWVKCNFFRMFENIQICHHFGRPFAPVFPRFGMSCDVGSGTCDFRLDSSHLLHHCKFNLLLHNACQRGAFCMDLMKQNLQKYM